MSCPQLGIISYGGILSVITVTCLSCLLQYGNFVDNLRLYVRGGSGGMGLPRFGGQGGNGGNVWVVATKNMTLKKIKDKYPQKRFVGGTGANSRFVHTNATLSLLSNANTEYLSTSTDISGFMFVKDVCELHLSTVSEH